MLQLKLKIKTSFVYSKGYLLKFIQLFIYLLALYVEMQQTLNKLYTKIGNLSPRSIWIFNHPVKQAGFNGKSYVMLINIHEYECQQRNQPRKKFFRGIVTSTGFISSIFLGHMSHPALTSSSQELLRPILTKFGMQHMLGKETRNCTFHDPHPKGR